jgi:hypothetical protein
MQEEGDEGGLPNQEYSTVLARQVDFVRVRIVLLQIGKDKHAWYNAILTVFIRQRRNGSGSFGRCIT